MSEAPSVGRQRIRVHLAEDQTLVRFAFRGMLAAYPEIEVIGESGDGALAVRQVETEKPDLVIMDLSMPRVDGIEATRRIKKRCPRTKVMVLTVDADERRVAQAISAGADGYVLKTVDPEGLLAALREVMGGTFHLSGDLSQDQVDLHVAALEDGAGGMEALTARERQVLALVAAGHTNREIADQLSISIKTVESHRINVMRKLDLHNAAQLTAFAVKVGLVS